MKKGGEEIPGFDLLWFKGKSLAHIPDPDFAAGVRRLVEAVRNPYRQIYLERSERLVYETRQRTHVGRILFLFGGKDTSFSGRYELGVLRQTDGGYEMLATVARTGERPAGSVRYVSSMTGRLLSIRDSSHPGHPALENLARLFERGDMASFRSFSFRKTVFLKKRGGLLRDRLDMRVNVEVRDIRCIDGNACLEGRFTMRKLSDSFGDAMWLKGTGEFTIRPDGILLRQSSHCRFKLRLLGIPMVSGSVRGSTVLSIVDRRPERSGSLRRSSSDGTR